MSPTLCATRGWWLHVDAAYGGAALALPELASRFAGVERADSVVIDPHKWLFAPLDCAAVLYRDPSSARLTHRQSAAYLDAFGEEHVNPSDLAFHLTRRARGLPLWFTLVVHGTDAFTAAIRRGVTLANAAADIVRARRRSGAPADGARAVGRPVRARRLDPRPTGTSGPPTALADGLAFVAPTTWHGRPAGRLVFLHPATDLAAVETLIARLR